MGSCRYRLVAILVLLLCAGACGRIWNERPTNYQTIVADPNHDRCKAARENERAGKLLQKCKWEEAEEALQQALIADVGYGPAHNNLGKIYHAQGKFYLAAWEFEYASKLMPDRPEPVNNLGLVYEAVDRYDRAIEFYTMAYQMAPQCPEYIGNLARARLKKEGHSAEIGQLLSDLLLFETRPEWVGWAREQLALAGPPKTEVLQSSFPAQDPPGSAEVVAPGIIYRSDLPAAAEAPAQPY